MPLTYLACCFSPPPRNSQGQPVAAIASALLQSRLLLSLLPLDHVHAEPPCFVFSAPPSPLCLGPCLPHPASHHEPFLLQALRLHCTCTHSHAPLLKVARAARHGPVVYRCSFAVDIATTTHCTLSSLVPGFFSFSQTRPFLPKRLQAAARQAHRLQHRQPQRQRPACRIRKGVPATRRCRGDSRVKPGDDARRHRAFGPQRCCAGGWAEVGHTTVHDGEGRQAV